MTVIYIDNINTNLTKEGERIRIESDKNSPLSLPFKFIEKVVIYERANISKAIIGEFISRRIPLIYCDWKGRYIATFHTPAANVMKIIKQIERYKDENYRFNTAKKIVEVKIKNQLDFLRKIIKTNHEPIIKKFFDEISRNLKIITKMKSINQLMGLEGKTSALYFFCLSKHIKDQKLKFEKRTKRPAKDPFNALLNLGYSTLLSEIVTGIQTEGLHPAVGFLHEIHRNRPSLALDVLEIFRHPVIDRLVIKLLNKSIIKPSDFEIAENITIKKRALRIFFEFYEKTFNSHVTVSGNSSKIILRQMLRHEINKLVEAILNSELWSPGRIRI